MKVNTTHEEETKKIKINSFIKNIFSKRELLTEKEFEKNKFEGIKKAIFAGLFAWLILGIITKNILLSAAISTIIFAIIFVYLLMLPILKKQKHIKKVEADLPLSLMKMSQEMNAGKGIIDSLKCFETPTTPADQEFNLIYQEIKKGASFSDALNNLNKRVPSTNIKRISSNLINIYQHGGKDILGLKKVSQELLLKQRIESKEFSSKMVVYSLIFIAVSAIIPAMFQSFILIGSYFMKINFDKIQLFAIIVLLFPLIDLSVLLLINSKTPEFLKN